MNCTVHSNIISNMHIIRFNTYCKCSNMTSNIYDRRSMLQMKWQQWKNLSSGSTTFHVKFSINQSKWENGKSNSKLQTWPVKHNMHQGGIGGGMPRACQSVAKTEGLADTIAGWMRGNQSEPSLSAQAALPTQSSGTCRRTGPVGLSSQIPVIQTRSGERNGSENESKCGPLPPYLFSFLSVCCSKRVSADPLSFFFFCRCLSKR